MGARYFLFKTKYKLKDLLRKFKPHSRSRCFGNYMVYGSFSTSSADSMSSLGTLNLSGLFPDPSDMENIPETSHAEESGRSSPDSYFYHVDPDTGLSWLEPRRMSSDSDWETVSSESSDSVSPLPTPPVIERHRLKIPFRSGNPALCRRLNRSVPLYMTQTAKAQHQPQSSVDATTNAQILGSPAVDKHTGSASEPADSSTSLKATSYPSSEDVAQIGSGSLQYQHQLGASQQYSSPAFSRGSDHLFDPFVEQAHGLTGCVPTTDDVKLSPNRPWDDFHSDDDAPVYQGNDCYALADGTTHNIVQESGDSCASQSVESQSEWSMLPEVFQQPLAPVLAPRITPEAALANAAAAMQGLTTWCAHVQQAMDDLADQTNVHFNNAMVNLQRAVRAEDSAEMAWSLLAERDAEISHLRSPMSRQSTPPTPVIIITPPPAQLPSITVTPPQELDAFGSPLPRRISQETRNGHQHLSINPIQLAPDEEAELAQAVAQQALARAQYAEEYENSDMYGPGEDSDEEENDYQDSLEWSE